MIRGSAAMRAADQQVVDGREMIGAHALADAHVGYIYRAGHQALIDPDAQHRGKAGGPSGEQPTAGGAIVYAGTLQHIAEVARPRRDVEIADHDAGLRTVRELAPESPELRIADARRLRNHRPVEMGAVQTECPVTE